MSLPLGVKSLTGSGSYTVNSTTSGGYINYVITFTSGNNTFAMENDTSAQYILVGGGGAGSRNVVGGGGGGGAVQTGSKILSKNVLYSTFVGTGGLPSLGDGNPGMQTKLLSSGDSLAADGGKGGSTSGTGGAGGTPNGANGGANGQNGNNGYTVNIITNGTYGGGGGGVGNTVGGTGGGGNGGSATTAPTNGLANTGGGGGGGTIDYTASAGGSGVVILAYSYNTACFLAGTKILTNMGYLPIETLQKGDLVKTVNDGFKPIFALGKKEMYHHNVPERVVNQLYKCSPTDFPDLFEDLILTGGHSLLVANFKDENQKQECIAILNDVYVTDDKYRIPACVDRNTTVFEREGRYDVYHIALENEEYTYNYGIFGNGLLVESCSKHYLIEVSEMEIL